MLDFIGFHGKAFLGVIGGVLEERFAVGFGGHQEHAFAVEHAMRNLPPHGSARLFQHHRIAAQKLGSIFGGRFQKEFEFPVVREAVFDPAVNRGILGFAARRYLSMV